MGTLIRDGVKIGGTTVYVDSNLSTTSENPVENKIVTSALNEKADISSLSDVATTGSYNDLSNKPEIDTNLSAESTNAVQNKVITNSLDEKYPIDYDVALSLAEWEALGDEKYYNHKNYYIYDAGSPTEKTTVYGWHVDPNESDPSSAITYIKEAVGMTPASMGTTNFNYGSWQNAFFMPKPCMVKENGEVDYYLDENDYKKKGTITITSSPADELPLSFNSRDDDVINYRIYGTTEGAGVKTEDLVIEVIQNASVNAKGTVITSNIYNASIAPVTAGTTYTLQRDYTSSYLYYAFFTDLPAIGSVSYNGSRTDIRVASVTITAPITGYVALLNRNGKSTVAEGNTAVPYGYKLPLTIETPNLIVDSISNCYINTSGELATSNTVNVAITPITEGNTYTILYARDSDFMSCGFFTNYPQAGDTSYDNARFTFTENYYTFVAPITGYLVSSFSTSKQPSVFEGFAEIPIYIGDSKLLADEYIDFAEQKIYKEKPNLVSDIIDNAYVNSLGVFSTNSTVNSAVTPIEKDKVYTVLQARGGNMFCGSFEEYPVKGASTYNGKRLTFASEYYTFTAAIDGYFVSSFSGSYSPVVYEGEYPRVAPTNPPVPIPTINAYQGENTLSSTETLGKISIYVMSDIANLNYTGNAMMEWPLIWWKYEANTLEGEGSFYISNKKIDDTYNCWCNYDSKNNITNHFYTAIYNGGIYNGKLRSMSGYKLTDMTSTVYSNTSTYAVDDKVLYDNNMYICVTAVEVAEEFDPNKWLQIPISGKTTGTQEVNAATANNTTSDIEWYIDTWSDRMLINGLLILMGKSLNVQATFGQGITSGEQTTKNNYTTGSLNDKGMFYGSVSGTTTAVKVFGMENWWGLCWHRTAGLLGTSTGYVYKMTYNNIDGSEATSYNSDGSGYLTLSTTRPTNNYVTKMKYGPFGYISIDTTGGSSTTYYCDYYYLGNGYLLVGGFSNRDGYSGVSCFSLNASFAYAYWGIGATLSLKPLT